MAKFTTTLTTDTFAKVCDIIRRRGDANNWQATAFVTGTPGGATATIQLSPDNGTTRFTARDWNGSSMTSSLTAVYTFQPQGNGAQNDDFISVWAALASSSSTTNVTFTVFDNR